MRVNRVGARALGHFPPWVGGGKLEAAAPGGAMTKPRCHTHPTGTPPRLVMPHRFGVTPRIPYAETGKPDIDRLVGVRPRTWSAQTGAPE